MQNVTVVNVAEHAAHDGLADDIYADNISSTGPAERHGHGGWMKVLVAGILAIAVIAVAIAFLYGGSGSAAGDGRERADTGVAFQPGCIVDELGWFDDASGTGTELEYFYEKTGVQPYIVLKDYDPELAADDEKDAYAENWYSDNISNEGTLLFMYFAEEDTDNEVGYMTLVSGAQIGTVMDADAIQVFWDNIDAQWYTDKSTDDMFVTVFKKTADTVMKKHTSAMDVLKYLIIGLLGLAALMAGIYAVKLKRRHEAERAAETERILKTPLQSSDDELVEKYLKKEEDE